MFLALSAAAAHDGALSGTPHGTNTEAELQHHVGSVLRGVGITDQTPEFTGTGARAPGTATDLERAPSSWTGDTGAPSTTLLGVRRGMTRADVDRMLGPGAPGVNNRTLMQVSYPGASVWFRLADGQVDQVNVTSPAQAALGVEDPVVHWYGRSRGEVQAVYGPGLEPGTDSLSYPLDGGQLAFWFHEGRCASITRFFFG